MLRSRSCSFPSPCPRSLSPLALSRVLVDRKAVCMWLMITFLCDCVPMFVSVCVSLTRNPLQKGGGAADSLDQELEDVGPGVCLMMT